MHGANMKIICLCCLTTLTSLDSVELNGRMTVNKTVRVRMNVVLRSVRGTVVAVQKQEVLHILSVCL